MNNKGQAVLAEYVMIFFVVIAAVVAVTVYVQRGLNARIHDARNFAVDSVTTSGACDANCMRATGGTISHEYEPYYTQMASNVDQGHAERYGTTTGSPQVIGAIYTKSLNEDTNTTSGSAQLPPSDAN